MTSEIVNPISNSNSSDKNSILNGLLKNSSVVQNFDNPEFPTGPESIDKTCNTLENLIES